MTDRRGSTAAGGTPPAGQPGSVRNVALVGHSGAGKTTLIEALLVDTGAIQRAGRVEDGTTVSDFDEVEVRQQRSVNLTLAPVTHAGVKVNLLDTPGYADFTGDLRAGLRAADAALFTVPATEGVDGLTRMLWEECALVGMPRAVVITKLDHQRADFDEALRACRDAFGDAVAPLYVPVAGDQGELRGLIGLLSGRFYDYAGGTRTERDPDPEQSGRVEELRSSLIEGIIQESEDESLMDRYLSGEDIDTKVLIEDLEKAVARGSFYPMLTVASPLGIGLAELLEVMTQAFPAPAEHPLPAVSTLDGKPVTGLSSDPNGPLLAEVVKTTSDPPDVGVRGGLDDLCDRTPWYTSPGTAWPSAATPTMTRTSGSARSPLRWASSSDRSRSAPRETSAPWPSCPAPRPATPCRTRSGRCSWRHGRCRSRCCRWRSTPSRRPTRTRCRTPSGGWWPRTRRCGLR